jgi:ketosteroid isomerase-like protein
MLRHILLGLIVGFTLSPGVGLTAEPDHEIHEELRALLKTAAEAINGGKFDDVLPVGAENLRITPITQEFCMNRQELSAYFAKYFGPGRKLRSLHITFAADALTELSPDKSWGLAYGKGLEDYTLNDGRVFAIPTRWTAVVAKEDDGKWRIRSMHIGTNFLDNPLINTVENAVKQYAIGAGVIGILVGLALGFVIGRRRR